MSKVKFFLRKNYKIILIVLIGLILAVVVAYIENIFKSDNLSYDNNISKLTSTSIKGAMDELSTKTTKIEDIEKKCPDGYICNASGRKLSTANSNIIKAYTYDQVNSKTKCITGEESTCRETKCVNYSSKGVCPAGTIIKYRVSSSTTRFFYVLHDDGTTMTLQQRENTINNITWNSSTGNQTLGPIVALEAIESATSDWTNVNLIQYEMGTTTFAEVNAYTGCIYNKCTENKYTLASRSSRARMITMQEAILLDCNTYNNSCPRFMNNYLANSKTNKGTINASNTNGYWTMSAASENSCVVWLINEKGKITTDGVTVTSYGARAVVDVKK